MSFSLFPLAALRSSLSSGNLEHPVFSAMSSLMKVLLARVSNRALTSADSLQVIRFCLELFHSVTDSRSYDFYSVEGFAKRFTIKL